jgi:CubicO group peptidase (beta-lactamase class C family)
MPEPVTTVLTPESAGIPSEAIERFYHEAVTTKMLMHSFMLLRHGNILTQGWWAPYRHDERHIIYSVSKSFTAIAVGFCIEEGLFTLEDKVVDLFPEKLDFTPHAHTRQMTVEHLLTMRSGHPYATDRRGPDWVKAFLQTPPPVPPGTLFGYDSTATHTLCALIQKVTGMTMMDYLKPRLFDKLGIEGIYCQQDPMGIDAGSRGIHAKTEDMAKFGQLMLQNGVWNGEQIVPAHWVAAATKKHVDTAPKTSNSEGNPGYGYQFWRLRGDAYGGLGSGGQLIIVIPHLDMVWVSTGNLLEDEGSLDLIIRLFWSTIAPFAGDGPLPENPQAVKRLRALERSLTLPLPEGKARSPLMDFIDGKTYAFDDNKAKISAVGFNKTAQGVDIRVRIGGEDWTIRAGVDGWVDQFVSIADDRGFARCVFADDQTLICHVHLALKLGTYKFVMHFHDDAMALHLRPTGWTDFRRFELLATGVLAPAPR